MASSRRLQNSVPIKIIISHESCIARPESAAKTARERNNVERDRDLGTIKRGGDSSLEKDFGFG